MPEPASGSGPEFVLGPRSIIVMAHPDDEVLWASSALAGAGRVLLVYETLPGHPKITEGRRAALARFPRPVESLRLDETASFDAAAWPDPRESPEGLEVRAHPGTMAGFTPDAYRAGFATLVARLRPMLDGIETVITHAPWGEYGHEDHVQLFRALDSLRAEMGFALWVPGYVSNRSAALMLRSLDRLGPPTPPRPTDPALGETLKALYRETGCWTWFDNYLWPATEVFYPVLPVRSMPPTGRAHPMNVIWMPQAPARRRASAPRRLVAWLRRRL